MIEIRHKDTGEVLHRVRGDTLAGARLRGLKLRGANLPRIDLRRADLRGTDLSFAELAGAAMVEVCSSARAAEEKRLAFMQAGLWAGSGLVAGRLVIHE